jgi:hypothetical protein
MKNSIFSIIISIIFFSCDKNTFNNKEDIIYKNLYNIETITYWDKPNSEKDSVPFVILKIDTINNIGSSVRFSETGILFEKIVILDKKKAIKLDYDNDTISLSTICNYKIRKDHPVKSIYSVVIW